MADHLHRNAQVERLLGKIGQLAKSLGGIFGGGASAGASSPGGASSAAAGDNATGGGGYLPAGAAGGGGGAGDSGGGGGGGVTEADAYVAAYGAVPAAGSQGAADEAALNSASGLSFSQWAGHAAGGAVHGPAGHDVIPARLTRGEFVNTVHAVRTLGTRFFHALNAAPERFAGLRDAIRGARGFSLGGLVESFSAPFAPPPLRLALGGMADGRPTASGSRFTLVLDGQAHEVHGEDHVIGSIERYARRRQLLSAGRRATSVGGG